MIAEGNNNIKEAYFENVKLYNIALGDTLLLPIAEIPKIITIFNVVSTTEYTRLLYRSSYKSRFKKMIIDSITYPIADTYLFDSIGDHIVEFIPSVPTEILGGNFRECIRIKSLIIPEGVTTIGTYLCYKDSNLIDVDMPSSVLSIGGAAFSNCTSLSTFIVRAQTPPTLGSNAFAYCRNVLIYVPDDSVDSYKAAWSVLASKIRAISTLE